MAHLQEDMKPGLSNIKMKKTTLREQVDINRAKHVAEYEEAMESYRKALVEFLQEQLKKAKKGEDVILSFHNAPPKPTSHVKQYDVVLKKLALSVDEEFTLSDEEFQEFIMDNWSWKSHFAATVANYKK